jgi:hypothetical protein
MSSKTKVVPTITTGPWTVLGVGNNARYVIGEGNVLVADCYADSPLDVGLPGLSEVRGNVRLIAAAPELLSALKRLLAAPDLNLDELEPETGKAFNDAIKAVAKAEGRRT